MACRIYRQRAAQGFLVTVRTATDKIEYRAIAAAAIDLYPAAYARFGACGVSVRPVAACTPAAEGVA